MSKNVVIVIVFGLVFLAVMVYMSMGLGAHRVEVCITYKGQQSCRVAQGSTQEEAIRQATSNACAFIASGMTDSIACANTTPDSVTPQ